MTDELLSKLTGVPIRQIKRLSEQQRVQLAQIAQKKHKLPKIDTTKADELLQERTTNSINGLIGRYGLSDIIKIPRSTDKPKHTPRELTDEEIQAEIELTKKLNPTYQYEHFASTKDPNRVGVKVTNPVTGEVAEYGASYVDMYGNEIKNPSWEYMGKGTLGEGQSWRKVSGTMKVNGQEVDASNKPIHSSATKYPEKKSEIKKENKSEQKNEKSSGFFTEIINYLKGPGEIKTNTPSYERRNLITESMQGIQNTFGNAYKPTPGSYGGGQFGGGGAGSVFYSSPEFEEIEEKKQLLVPVTKTWNRDQAFAQARKEGKKTFWFNGKEYTTELGTKPASAAHDIETKVTGIVPVEYNKKRKVLKKNK